MSQLNTRPGPGPGRWTGRANEIDAVIDRAEFEETIGGDGELLDTLAESIRRGIPAGIEGIREAIAAGDAPAVRQRAHRLKGALANFHATAAVQAAYGLEELGR